MRNTRLFALVVAVALSGECVAVAVTVEEERQAAIARVPAPAPGPAFPDVAEIDMAALCGEGTGLPERFYPPRALSRGRSGDVVLDCVVTDTATLATCQVLYEAPTRFGFGDAAVRIACHFRLEPAVVVDGEPSGQLPQSSRFYRRNNNEPRHARIPIRFRLG